MQESWIPYVVVGMVVVLAGVVWLSRRHRSAQLLELASLFDDNPRDVHGVFSVRLDGHWQGRAASLELEPGGKNQPPKLHVRLGCASTLAIRVGREFAGASILKSLKLVKDIETGDPGLDAAYLFASDEPERLAAWVRGREEPRAGLRALLDRLAFTRVELKDQTLRATRDRYNRDTLERSNVRAVLEALEGLARSLETGA